MPLMGEIRTTSAPDNESLSYRILKRVAKFHDVEPEQLDPSLFEAVDPDVLNQLGRREPEHTRSWQFVFTYCGCEVTVESDGSITVEALDDGSALDLSMMDDLSKYR